MICFAQIMTHIEQCPKNMHNICARSGLFAQNKRYLVRKVNLMHNQYTQSFNNAQKTKSSVQNYSVWN
jgi:hypothetical protein